MCRIRIERERDTDTERRHFLQRDTDTKKRQLLQRILEHTTVPISGKELWRQQDEQLLQRALGFVIRERLVSCRVIVRC